MCGIAGRFGPPQGHDESLLRRETCHRWLGHRGPDARGTWVGQGGAGDEVALLHARLAIIDLTPGGAQPFASDDGQLQLVFNGEIYNYQELKAELARLGARFHTESDTEVLLRAYEQWGEDCLRRLRGMFAFTLWDARKQELFCARDRLGIKPFFYAAHGGSFVFASELRPLFALDDVPRDLDLSAVDDYFTYLYTPPPLTIYQHVRELEPAHLLVVRRKNGQLQLTTRRYWNLPKSRLVVDEEEAARLVRKELETVVRQHALSDVPLGAFLSGGLDSTTLVGLMAQHSSKPVRTFCMTFGPEERLYDERQFARVVSDRFATEHTSVPVRPDVTALLPQIVRHFGQPFGNPTALLVAELSRQTRKHVTVALAGDGGDELFLGYPRYLGLRVKERYQQVPERLREFVAAGAERLMTDSLRGQHTFRRAREFLTTGTVPPNEAYTSWISYFERADRDRLFSDDVRRHLAGRRAEEWMLQILASAGRADPAERASQADVQTFLPGNLLAYGDRMSMMHALEVRVPFCDHVLVELLLSITPDLKMPGKQTKALLRKACADLIPEEISRRGKLGFNPPMALWLKGPLSSMVEGLVGRLPPALQDHFSPEAVKTLVDEHRTGRRDRSLHIWSLLVFNAWREADREDSATLASVLSNGDLGLLGPVPMPVMPSRPPKVA